MNPELELTIACDEITLFLHFIEENENRTSQEKNIAQLCAWGERIFVIFVAFWEVKIMNFYSLMLEFFSYRFLLILFLVWEHLKSSFLF